VNYFAGGVEGLRRVVCFFHHAQSVDNSGFGRLMYFGQEAVVIFLYSLGL
jgi:hypothetical protein